MILPKKHPQGNGMTTKLHVLAVVALGLAALTVSNGQPMSADERAVDDSMNSMESLVADEDADGDDTAQEDRGEQSAADREVPGDEKEAAIKATSSAATAFKANSEDLPMGLMVNAMKSASGKVAALGANSKELPVGLVLGDALEAVMLMHAGKGKAADLLLPEPGLEESGFEKDVTDLVLSMSHASGGATPMGSSIEKIKNVIEDEMIPAIHKAHKKDQTDLLTSAKAVTSCGIRKTHSLNAAKRQENIYKAKSPVHKSCRATEAGLYQQNVACHEDWLDKKQVKELKCKFYSDVSKRTGNQNANKQIVTKGGGESVETYVTRISATICGKARTTGNGGFGQTGLLDDLLDAKQACERATKAFNLQTKKCAELDKQWHNRKKKCNNIQDDMDNAACKHAVETKDACESYAECYKDRREGAGGYVVLERKVRQEEIDRKAEWKGTKRMLCIILAFNDGKVEQSEIDTCKAKTHSTDHLNIKWPQLPELEKCKVPDRYPTTAAYKAAEFTPLPVLAKGKVDANECTGVAEVSTVPNAGSPSSCKCERVTMNGPYSPGPLVKCVNCLVIRRSVDKSSCPVGTKLFAPRSRQDWDSFIKSADPLRAPNWVIDVTRPQNGCGGCTRYSMNSQTSQQQSWVTQDGSPWWLRSTRYSEPNGDYHANCYLDLWRTPANADSVTWNDGSCSYHSKSYYCQAFAISTSPKAGSPTGCACKKVELNGEYSTGLLVKCTGCLDVRRASDKNSCPKGTKIFAPQSRADWKTFIASATPLRNPHWIIDVTRPQNGCGGCTRHTMNSGTAAQATWRTADGAPWWLRSTRYNEPNGDYHANCYLDLWRTPSNENSVGWNDGNCNYHSRSYYCQAAKGRYRKPARTAAAPPWRAQQVSTKPKDGSPSACKCETLGLKGTYSSGAILKCTNCLDVRKKTDKDSCPEGTKIFSPESRSDWKTFLASGGAPLRAPNWIIDITRPQNGCGGCTGNAMNSVNSAQSTWKTSDGSPWWLRSRTYSEPNGDYDANCYLDLWKTPTDENHVMWNDLKCTYHSKSYYCQPKALG